MTFLAGGMPDIPPEAVGSAGGGILATIVLLVDRLMAKKPRQEHRESIANTAKENALLRAEINELRREIGEAHRFQQDLAPKLAKYEERLGRMVSLSEEIKQVGIKALEREGDILRELARIGSRGR